MSIIERRLHILADFIIHEHEHGVINHPLASALRLRAAFV